MRAISYARTILMACWWAARASTQDTFWLSVSRLLSMRQPNSLHLNALLFRDSLNQKSICLRQEEIMNSLANSVPAGVATGDQVKKLYQFAKQRGCAYPAVNVVGTNSINATLEAARLVNSPVIVQLSHGGSSFFCGKSLQLEGHESSTLSSIAAAHYVHAVAYAYGVPVILHADHAAKVLLPWIDGLLTASEEHFARTGKPLFS